MTPSAPLPRADASAGDHVPVNATLARVLGSSTFAASERLQQFLRYVVEETLAGRGRDLKEYSIGVQVYGRGAAFDPKADSIVRSEARRLRAKLQQYHEGEGATDALVIDLPVGGYRPEFRVRDVAAPHAGETGAVIERAPQPLPTAPVDAPLMPSPLRRSNAPTQTGGTPSRRATAVGLVVLLAGVVAAIGWLARTPTPPPRRATVLLIAPFEQRTAVAIPPGALETALEFELGRSRVLSVVPRVRIEDTLRLMKLPSDAALTPAVAMQVAARDSGIDAVVSGWIASAGAGYALHGSLRDGSGTRVLGVTQHPFATPDDGVRAAGALAAWVRDTLRDAPAEPRGDMDPAATRSLPALQSYNQGLALMNQDRWVPAKALFADAVREDPDFATAHIHHAWALLNTDHPREEVLAAVRRAEAAAAAASERERLFIHASARDLEGRIEEARALYDALIRLYPGHLLAVRNLTRHGVGFGPETGALYWTRWAETRPTDPMTAFQAAHWLALQGEDAQTARRYIDRARALNTTVDVALLLDWLAAGLAFRTGDSRAYAPVIRRAAEIPSSPTHAVQLGVVLLSGGRPRAAEHALGTSDVPRIVHRWGLAAALSRGDRERAAVHVAGLAPTRANPLSTILLVWAGALGEADAMAARRAESFTPGANRTEVDGLWAVADAVRLLARGEGSRAAALLRPAMLALAGTHFPDAYIGARALARIAEQDGRAGEARTLLRRALANRKGAYENALIFWMACARDLIRLERSGGDVAAADRLERELALLLAAADSDFAPEKMGLFPLPHP